MSERRTLLQSWVRGSIRTDTTACIDFFFAGFMDAQPETMFLADLNETEKLILCCHLVS